MPKELCVLKYLNFRAKMIKIALKDFSNPNAPNFFRQL